MLEDDKLYWCIYMSPGQCYNKNTVPPSRYCMRFIIFAKLRNLTTGYTYTMHLYRFTISAEIICRNYKDEHPT